ncbi:MAG: hypothetical protein P8M78_06050, partial [Myxococcota bacterium]|nr:hypothetical protein [Myxococcota bacterium]
MIKPKRASATSAQPPPWTPPLIEEPNGLTGRATDMSGNEGRDTGPDHGYINHIIAWFLCQASPRFLL